ncbi:twin-arginine translocase TatA/TatE family subunit [Verrucomicrobia bacterium S94]|nr:twin-arginine translocase TatA/TatE family subunit [Verrucomicrobia bacterium S94]
MTAGLSQFGFIGPGGPELIVVMLVLIMVFGAKDAPKIFRKINEFMSTVRNTADSFKREIMYGDLTAESAADDMSYEDDDYDYTADYPGEDYDDSEELKEQDYSDETFQHLEQDLEDAGAEKMTGEPADGAVSEKSGDDGGDDAEKA